MEIKNVDPNSSVCRACLTPGAKSSIFSIYKPFSLPYSYIFSSCTTAQVDIEDDLPKQICRKCLKTLVDFYRFKNRVLENDLKLRETQVENKNNDTRLRNDIGKESLTPASESTSSKINAIKTEDNVAENEIPELKFEFNCGSYDSKLLGNEETEVEKYLNDGLDKDIDSLGEIKEQTTSIKKKTYQCDVCRKIVNSKSNLTQHYQTHTGERCYTCDICGKKFLRAGHVLVHKRTHTGEEPYRCTVCLKTFKQSGSLKTHMRVHNGECPFVCSVCGKTFKHSSSLRYHTQIHSNDIRYSCNICEKSFKNAGYLKVHMRFHSDRRPFPCEKCDQKFFTSSHLKVHIRGHDNVTSHKCIVCGKGFVRLQHLKIHLTTHTGEKAYACTLCPKTFTQQSHLARHIKIHKRIVVK